MARRDRFSRGRFRISRIPITVIIRVGKERAAPGVVRVESAASLRRCRCHHHADISGRCRLQPHMLHDSLMHVSRRCRHVRGLAGCMPGQRGGGRKSTTFIAFARRSACVHPCGAQRASQAAKAGGALSACTISLAAFRDRRVHHGCSCLGRSIGAHHCTRR